VAVEQAAEGVEFADAPFGGGGQVRPDEGELGESFEGAPASSGAALLDLDGPDRPLGLAVGEDVQVGAGGEPQDEVLVAEEPAGDALPSDRHACCGTQHVHPARAGAVARPALARQRALPGGSGVTCCCRPDDVAQVPGQPACLAWRVAGQIEEVVQVGGQHSQDCTGSRWPRRLAG
jgi:hypothetical protein